MTTSKKMTKEEAFEKLMELKEFYETNGDTFILCVSVPENDGAWLFYNRLQESKTKELVKTVQNNVDLFFVAEKVTEAVN